MSKCINGFYSIEKYSEYYNSHNWNLQVNHSKIGRGQLWICEDCGEVRKTPSGTIDFSFGCTVVGVDIDA